MACGLPSDTSADTQPNGGGILVAAQARPEPTPAPITHPSHPARVTEDPAATNPGSGVFCGRCGSAVDPLSEFCGICGYPLREDAVVRVRQERAQRVADPLAEADAADTLPPLGTASANNFVRLIGMMLVGIVIIGIAFGLLILQRR